MQGDPTGQANEPTELLGRRQARVEGEGTALGKPTEGDSVGTDPGFLLFGDQLSDLAPGGLDARFIFGSVRIERLQVEPRRTES